MKWVVGVVVACCGGAGAGGIACRGGVVVPLIHVGGVEAVSHIR